MTDWLSIIVLFVLGAVLLFLELILPAYGVLGLLGAAMIGYALYATYSYNELAALIGLAVIVVLLPAGLVIGIKNWPRIPMIRYLSPPNPNLTEADRLPVGNMHALLGTVGRALTPLRPVGMCLFNGQRLECKAEHGMIDKDTDVQAVRLMERTLIVRQFGCADNESPEA